MIQAHNIVHTFKNREVLRGNDVSVQAGELVALLGPNGAGKTTLIRILAGILRATSGRVQLTDQLRIGWVPQGRAVYPRLTVRENIELFARLLKLEKGLRDHVDDALESSLLRQWENSLSTELSGGLRQRLSVAIGLLGSPDLLLLDEPNTGVDIVHRIALNTRLAQLKASGRSALFTTHALEDALFADRVIVLVDGKIVFDDSPASLETLGREHGDLADSVPGDSAPGATAAERGFLRLCLTDSVGI